MSHFKRTNIHATKIILIFLVILKTSPAYNQNGCTDSTANNYDPSATVNDGSCTYNVTNYFPPVVVNEISDTVKESSGLQWVGNSLWSFNDKDGTPDLYRIDTASKAILQTVRLAGATNVDWEEVTFDGTYFYVGDFGNNLTGARTNLKIYKFPYNAIPDFATTPKATIPSEKIEIIKFKYIDQSQPPLPVALDSTKFDCEAMVVSDGKIHLFTKNWIDYTSTHYVINSTEPGNYMATPVDTLKTGYLVTGASKAPDQKLVVLLGYLDGGLGNHYMHLLYDYSGGKYFNGNKRLINLPPALEMGQAEGITFRNNHYGYISNERFERKTQSLDITVSQKLRSFDLNSFIPSIVLAIDLKYFNVNKISSENNIAWGFSSPAHNVRIERSLNGVNFNTLTTYDISIQGSFIYRPIDKINYYRISWEENNGLIKHSKIWLIENKTNDFISNVLLKTTGELSFVLTRDQEENFQIKLLTTDGKELSQLPKRSYKPGLNKIRFPANPASNSIVLVTIYGSKEKMTRLVHVIK